MKLVEIFLSIDGEGKRTGLPTIFIRKVNCNLRCGYCFGDRGGRYRTPSLKLGYKNNTGIGSHSISIRDAKIGQNIMTLDEDLNLVETTIVDKIEREVTEWYEVKIDGRTYCITGDHPMFTTRGLVKVEDLRVGDVILDVKGNQYMSYCARVENNQSKPENKKKQVENTNWKKMGSTLSKTLQKQKEEGAYVPSWYKLSEERKDEVRKKISKSNSGENNGNYNPDLIRLDNYYSLKNKVKSGEIVRSELSGKTPEEDGAKCLHVHHIDGNRNNDDPSNLIVVTSKEHNQIHERGYNFWINQESRKDGKRILSKIYEHNGKEVQEIKYVNISNNPYFGKSYGPKPLKVYNFTCSPYNTYLIDNMYVHNCDTKQSWDCENPIEMSVDDIIDLLMTKWPWCRSVTFTGGEPLFAIEGDDKVELNYLLTLLDIYGYDVNIETNGSIPIDSYLEYRPNIWFTMDYKSISSGMNDHMELSNMYLLDENDVLKFVVGSKTDLNDMKYILESYHPKAQVYVSPIFGEIDPKDIVSYVLNNKLRNVKVQLQMHKIIWSPETQGV